MSAVEVVNGLGKRRWQPQLPDGSLLFAFTASGDPLYTLYTYRDDRVPGERWEDVVWRFWPVLYRRRRAAERCARYHLEANARRDWTPA